MNLNEIKEALSKATPGPWYAIKTEVFVENGPVCKLWGDRPSGQFSFENYENNANLIANAPEWLASLIEQNEQILQANERLSKKVQIEASAAHKARRQVEEMQKTLKEIASYTNPTGEDAREMTSIARQTLQSLKGAQQ